MDVRQTCWNRRRDRSGAWVALAAAVLSSTLFGASGTAQGARSLVASSSGQAGKRVALVIGNAAYEHTDPLRNPGNDADGMAAALGRLGFEVVLGKDLDLDGFYDTLGEFDEASRGADVTLFFYAGHGLQVQGKNWLAPVDAKLGSRLDLERGAVELDTVLEHMRGSKKLVYLDACRNNPLAGDLARTMGLSRTAATSRGLARVQSGSGTLIGYATAPDDVAADGEGRNSPFTEALLEHIETPGLSVNDMFGEVSGAVSRATGGKQVPWSHSSLGRFYLASAAAPPPKVTETTGGGTSSTAGDAAKEAYDTARELGTVAAWRIVVEDFPNSTYAKFAQAQIDKLEGAKEPAVVAGGDPVVEPVVSAPRKSGTKFRDCEDCPEMVVVPSGSYRMGSPSSESGSEIDEGPEHEVTIARPFAVGVYEVTFDEWDACVSDKGCGGRGAGDEGWGRGRHPVINVKWDDVQAYVEWLSRKTGEEYRLLSEAEWEYVARAGTRAAYWWGDSIGHNRANCDGCGSRWDDRQTAPVGSFSANPFGLYDVHGNVWERVEDCWQGGYFGAPSDGSAWKSGHCGRRVARGGSWYDGPSDLRSANRDWSTTSDWHDYVGFRVARTLTP